ncbi:MAG: ATP-binding protein [Holophaga sp.]|nr:ATP-binding protein [Holophaga sp.]
MSTFARAHRKGSAVHLCETRADGLAKALLVEANEKLVLATVQAQELREAAELAAEQTSAKAKLELQIQEAQKLETLGVLAGGVAHDFNNLLTTIMGNAELGTLAAEPHSQVAGCFEAISKAVTRAADLTRQLLAYSGKGRYRVAELDLGIQVQEAAQILAVSMPRQVTLRLDLAPGLPLVLGESTQVFQILMNLVGNAADASALNAEGRITLRTAGERIDAAAAKAGPWVLAPAPGNYVVLEVADDGAGMTAEVAARAFEPFFTTKFSGRGLGLAAVLGILRSHGGGLRVRSAPGEGSAFTLYLPALEGPRP